MLALSLIEEFRSAAYLTGSGRRLRAQYPFFAEDWYLKKYPELSGAKEPPIVHYFSIGWQEGREPHYLFWSDWYQRKNLRLDHKVDPLLHFLESQEESQGEQQGHQQFLPHPLFDPNFYREQLGTRAKTMSVTDLWVDYVVDGSRKGLSPFPLFDASFYRNQAGLDVGLDDAFRHYLEEGFRLGLSPSPEFDESFYRARYADVALSDTPGLLHYQMYGINEGRATSAEAELGALPTLKQGGRLANVPAFEIKRNRNNQKQARVRLNLLLPRVSARYLTGGPNTALALMGLLANALDGGSNGVVRIVATEESGVRVESLRAHIERLIGTSVPRSLEVTGVGDTPLSLSDEGESFVATTWSTAQSLSRAGLATEENPFWYLIQDFEPAFYPSSSDALLASQTYAMPHRAIVNTPWLLDFLATEQVGRFADSTHVANSLSFWPAVDRSLFRPDGDELNRGGGERVKRLVVYARPDTAPRNLFEIALAGIRSAFAAGAFAGGNWEFIAIGDALPPTLVADETPLVSVPWVSMDDYARNLRQADVLVSLMASAHPSYPPLEGAVANCRVVTNTWKCKTADRLAQVIPSVFAAEPEIASVSNAIFAAASNDEEKRNADTELPIPANWAQALAPVVEEIKASLAS